MIYINNIYSLVHDKQIYMCYTQTHPHYSLSRSELPLKVPEGPW